MAVLMGVGPSIATISFMGGGVSVSGVNCLIINVCCVWLCMRVSIVRCFIAHLKVSYCPSINIIDSEDHMNSDKYDICDCILY